MPRSASHLVQQGQKARRSVCCLFLRYSWMYWQGQRAEERCRGSMGLPPSSSTVQSRRWRRKSLAQRWI